MCSCVDAIGVKTRFFAQCETSRKKKFITEVDVDLLPRQVNNILTSPIRSAGLPFKVGDAVCEKNPAQSTTLPKTYHASMY